MSSRQHQPIFKTVLTEKLQPQNDELQDELKNVKDK